MPSHSNARPRISDEVADSFTIVGGAADAGLVLLCDHARNTFPPGYGTLGLPEAQLQRHIAYDIGAEAITRHLAARLGVPAVHTHFSRLLIDPNRGADDPTMIMRLSDGAIVPGNRHLDAAERDRRVALYHRPYHAAVGRVLDQCGASGVTPAILSIHSFTESWKSVPRPWHVGILWDKDPRMAKPLLDALYAEGDLIVGDNQPYHGGLEGDTMWQHGTSRGLAHALIEVRQDLIRAAAGQKAWGDRLTRLMRQLLDRPDLQLSFRKPRSIATGSIATTETSMTDQAAKSRTELEAAAFRRLVEHLRNRTDVQNIDLMNLAGFCRNCLANWYQDASAAAGEPVAKDAARELIYGMPYEQWRAKYQIEANAEKKAAFEKAKPKSH